MSFRQFGTIAYIDKTGKIYELSENDIDSLKMDVHRVAETCGRFSAKAGNGASGYKALSNRIIGTHHWTPERLKQFCNKKFSYASVPEIGHLIESIKNISEIEISKTIDQQAPSLASSKRAVASRQSRRIAIEFDDNLENQSSFTDNFCTSYFILRMDGSASYSVAEMVVGGRFYGDISTFRTIRMLKDKSLGTKTVEGIIYRSDGLIQSIGLLSNSSHVRFAALRRFGKQDLYGIRQGLLPDEERPFATRIFCVSMKGIDIPKELGPNYQKKYTGIFSEPELKKRFSSVFKSDFLKREIDFNKILRLIEFPEKRGPMIPASHV